MVLATMTGKMGAIAIQFWSDDRADRLTCRSAVVVLGAPQDTEQQRADVGAYDQQRAHHIQGRGDDQDDPEDDPQLAGVAVRGDQLDDVDIRELFVRIDDVGSGALVVPPLPLAVKQDPNCESLFSSSLIFFSSLLTDE